MRWRISTQCQWLCPVIFIFILRSWLLCTGVSNIDVLIVPKTVYTSWILASEFKDPDMSETNMRTSMGYLLMPKDTSENPHKHTVGAMAWLKEPQCTGSSVCLQPQITFSPAFHVLADTAAWPRETHCGNLPTSKTLCDQHPDPKTLSCCSAPGPNTGCSVSAPTNPTLSGHLPQGPNICCWAQPPLQCATQPLTSGTFTIYPKMPLLRIYHTTMETIEKCHMQIYISSSNHQNLEATQSLPMDD